MLRRQASGSSDDAAFVCFGLRDRLRTEITTLRHYDDGAGRRRGWLARWGLGAHRLYARAQILTNSPLGASVVRPRAVARQPADGAIRAVGEPWHKSWVTLIWHIGRLRV